jgi:predicted nucleic acid-binding protein
VFFFFLGQSSHKSTHFQPFCKLLVLIKKYKYTLSEAHEIAESLLELCEIVPVDETTIRQAILLAKTYSLSHWDSLIVSSALLAGCNVLLTEDMQHGQVFNN